MHKQLVSTMILIILSSTLGVKQLHAQQHGTEQAAFIEFPGISQAADSQLNTVLTSIQQRPHASQPDSLRKYLWQAASKFIDSGFYELSLRLYQYSDKVAPISSVNDINDRNVLYVKFYNGIALPYMNWGKLDIAVRYLEKSLKYAMKVPNMNKLIIAGLYGNMATILTETGELPKANGYYDRAIQLFTSTTDTPEILAGLLVNKAALYKGEEAIQYYQQACDIAKKYNNRYVYLSAMMNMGNVYNEMGATDKAIDILERTYKETEAHRMNALLQNIYIYEYLGKAYGDAYIANHQESYYVKAEKFMLKALEHATQKHTLKELYQINLDLAMLYKAKGRVDKALMHYEAYIRWYEEVMGQEKITAVNQIEVKYHMAEKDLKLTQSNAVILQQKEKLHRNRMLMLAISGVTLFMALGFWGFYRSYKSKKELQNKEQEVALLKAMITGEEKARNIIAKNLHDGIGSMLSVAKMKLSREDRDVEIYNQGLHLLDDVYKELRHTAHNLSPEILKREGLLHALEDLCTKMSTANKTNICFEVFGTMPRINQDIELSLYRIAQELIHNILKHAHATDALMQVSIYDENLSIIVHDNGQGISEQTYQGGIGLINLKERVKLLNGTIDIDSRIGTGTTIYLEFAGIFTLPFDDSLQKA